MYLITCNKSIDEYIGSAVDFKSRSRIRKSDTKTKKNQCGTSRHFSEKGNVPLLLLGMPKLKLLNKSTHLFGMEKDTGKVNCS